MEKKHTKTEKNGMGFITSRKIDFNQITIQNDVMFSSVFRDPEDCRELLQRILEMKIREIVVSDDQKSIKAKPWSKGIRLDIYVKDMEGNVYDIEMQVLDTQELALRSRYYHSEMDSYQIQAGHKYTELKASIVIFICGFDLFEQDRSIYTFKTICKEDTELELNDKRTSVFVNLKGSREGLPPELVCLLDYLESSEATDDFTDRINGRVENLKNDFEWRENYMMLEMKMEERFEAGLEQGLEQGREQGLEQGREQGLAQGIKILLYDVHMTIPEIAEKLSITEEEVQGMVDKLKKEM